MIFEQFRKKQLAFKVASAIAVAGMIGAAGADTKSLDLKISEQDAGKALMELGERAGVEILLTQEVGRSVKLTGLEGAYTLKGALDAMLKGSGLIYEFISENSILIKAAEETDEQDSESSDSESESVDEEIVVTGSRIARTPSQMAANVLVLDGDELRASGESTLEGALRRLPQNMFGASPVGATVPGSASVNGAINITGASTINLRGLGSESTLILVDGRRIGKTGVFGGVSDITGIPFSAVERVEILLDGASSIYGSDAVGGVVNVIMKKDYQGLEISHEYGTPQQGGFEEHVFSVNGGFSWNSGQLRVTYEHFQSSNLDGDERPERIAWSRFGSPARVNGLVVFIYEGQRYFPSDLIQVLGLPADSHWLTPAFYPGVSYELGNAFLPESQDGTNLSIGDFPALLGVENVVSDELIVNSDTSQGISLLPSQQRDNLNISFEQAFSLWGSEVTLSGAAYYSQRQTYAANGGFVFTSYLSELDNFNPFGQIDDIGVGLSLNWYIPELAERHYQTDQDVSRWNLALDGIIGEDWRWTLAAGQSRDKTDSNYFNESIDTRGENISPEGYAVYRQLLQEGLNLYASDIVAANSPELLARLIVPESPTYSLNEENTLELKASGKLFSLTGGDVHLAIGADWRQETLETESSRSIFQTDFSLSVGDIAVSSLLLGDFSRQIESKTQRSGYIELVLPVVGVNNAITGVNRLTLTGSARYDSYHEQGSDSVWSLGAIWNPIDQITVRVNQATSFVVPSFRDQLAPVTYTRYGGNGRSSFIFDENNQIVGVDFIRQAISGGNPDLKPEAASSLVAGLQFRPDLLPGLVVSATWRQTQYSNRIGGPQIQLIDGVDYVAVFPNISRDEEGLLVMDYRSVNIGGLKTAGVDYQLDYTRDTDYGRFIASANISYVSKYDRIQTAIAEPVNQVGDIDIVSRTVIPATRYSTRLGWYHRGFSCNLTADTSSSTVSTGYRDSPSRTVERRTVNPALNTHLTMAYDFEQGDLFSVPGWLQRTSVEIAVLNVLDDHTETSVIDTETGEPSIYSELNANTKDPRGRMFKLGITKRF